MVAALGNREHTMATIHCERAYDTPARDNAYRVLVDRLWPRGIKKENLPLDDWLKEIAPSTALRRWFNHDADKWPEFRRRYRKELEPHSEALRALLRRAGQRPVVLVYAARDHDHNNAVVLRDYLQSLA